MASLYSETISIRTNSKNTSKGVELMPYPEKPEDFEISEAEWEAYCRDMEEMRLEYERLAFGDE